MTTSRLVSISIATFLVVSILLLFVFVAGPAATAHVTATMEAIQIGP